MTEVILVIDMLRGFLEEGHNLYCGPRSRKIIPNISKLLNEKTREGTKIYFVCDEHETDDPEFKLFPSHCIKGTSEAQLINELRPFAGKHISKKHFSAFHETILEKELEDVHADKLIVCGVCTDICILHTIADARRQGYEVEVPVDCVASFDDRAHYFALKHISEVLGARLSYPKSVSNQQSFETSQKVLSGDTADIYFVRTVDILRKEGINPQATMEIFPRRAGILCGINEIKALLSKVLSNVDCQVWALSEGESFEKNEVVLRIKAPYQSYGIYETAYLGMLSHSSGWATAARECVESACGIPVISFGARHVHPSVVDVMEYSAIVGGCQGCASNVGAKLAGISPVGTIPHALIIILGDTVKASLLFDKHMPAEIPRIALVDTFEDEVRESINVAKAMDDKLSGVRLDTPSERGRVTANLVKEVRAWLDLEGYNKVEIVVSGGINPERIDYFLKEGAPIDAFAVGSYISNSSPIDFTADLHEVNGKPIAKRGRMPGISENPRLRRIL